MIYTVTLNPALDRELAVPELRFDDVLRADEVRIDCGGKGFNVSRMLAALGAESVALGFAGGRTGQTLEDGLAALGIRTAFTPIAGETRTNVSVVENGHAHHLKVNEPGPLVTPAEQAALLEEVEALVQGGDWWVLAGSLPRGVAPEFYASLIDLVQSGGAHAILDTSGAALRAGCAAAPLLAKPNAQEAGELTGMPVSTPAEARAAAAKLAGVQLVAISMGADGAMLVSGQRAWLATPPAIVERNPIGAGDALVGGLVWGLSQGLELPAVLRWGVACGAAAAGSAGTAMGDRAEVERLGELVDVREL